MKKKSIGYLFIALSVVTLADCGTSENTMQKSKVDQKDTKESLKNDSGVTYELIKEGAGASPRKGQIVVVDYTRWLEENGKPGKKIESTVDNDEPPLAFEMGSGTQFDYLVIGMKIGEKRRFIVSGTIIDIELIDVSDK